MPDTDTPTAETTLRALLDLLPDSSDFIAERRPDDDYCLLSDWNTVIAVTVTADEYSSEFNADLMPRKGWPATIELEAEVAQLRLDLAEAQRERLQVGLRAGFEVGQMIEDADRLRLDLSEAVERACAREVELLARAEDAEAEAKRLRNAVSDGVRTVGIVAAEAQRQIEARDAEVSKLRADLATAAGEYLVPCPEAGTPMAILLSANILLRRENERLRADVRNAKRALVERIGEDRALEDCVACLRPTQRTETSGGAAYRLCPACAIQARDEVIAELRAAAEQATS